jgi:hypothetical protein
MNGGHRLLEVASDVKNNQRAQKYLQQEVRKFISELKI